MKKFEKYKEELSTRLNQTASALGSMGIDSAPIDTKGLIELYYNSYNPQLSEEQKVSEMDNTQVESPS